MKGVMNLNKEIVEGMYIALIFIVGYYLSLIHIYMANDAEPDMDETPETDNASETANASETDKEDKTDVHDMAQNIPVTAVSYTHLERILQVGKCW